MTDISNEEGKKFGTDLKIIIVGDLSTGKTSILNRYINQKFEKTNKATIAPEFSYKIVQYATLKMLRVQPWVIQI